MLDGFRKGSTQLKFFYWGKIINFYPCKKYELSYIEKVTFCDEWVSANKNVVTIFYYRKVLNISNEILIALWNIILCIIKVYIHGFYTANICLVAPRVDLDLLKRSCTLMKSNFDVGYEIIQKFKNHLWYLSPELCCLGLFDNDVNDCVKDKMAFNILNKTPDNNDRIVKGELDIPNESK